MKLPIHPDFSKHEEIRNFLLHPYKVGHVLKMNAGNINRRKIVKHYLPNNCYVKIHMFLWENDDKSKYSWKFSSKVPATYPNSKKYINANETAIKLLKLCRCSNEYAIIDISLKRKFKGKYPGFDVSPYSDKSTNHSVTVILHMKDGCDTVQGYYIDSAARGSEKNKHTQNSLENDISKFLGLKVDMIDYDDEECPVFNVQHGNPWCATWSLFIFISHILNNSRKEVYEYLKKIKEKCRYRIIGLFLFEIWEITDKPVGLYGKFYNKKLYDVWNFK